MTPLRSLLFVPGDRPERFAKAIASGADAIILDLEDSVVPERKDRARRAVADHLAQPSAVTRMVRINPLGSGEIGEDIAMLRETRPDVIMLPKAEGATSIRALEALFGAAMPDVLPIATETAAAMFELGSYRSCADRLAALSWGAEDLSAALGASSAREEDGRYTPPYELARSLTLFAAHAAGVPAIDTVFPPLDDIAALSAYVARARRDGFTGMLALHPVQVGPINQGFSPSVEDVRRARAIVDAFAANPDAGVLALDGQMIDRPHLIQAIRLLGLAASLGGGA